MQKIHLYIFGGLAIFISVLAVATLSYAGGEKVRIPIVTDGIQAMMDNIFPPEPSAVAVLPSNNETPTQLITATATNSLVDDRSDTPINNTLGMPLEWKTFDYNGFSFEIPGNWQAVWPATEEAYTTLLLQDENGSTAALIVSPPPTTGYPGYEITEQEKIITGQGWTHRIQLWHGKPEAEMSYGYLDTIIVSRVGYENESGNMFDPRYGIQIFSQYKEDASEVFEKIYNSIEYNAKWNDYSGDIYSFQYPTDWTVEEEAGVGHRWVEFFDKNNKLTASMTCPIPKSDKTADKQIESLRTFELIGIQYAFKHTVGFGAGNNPGANTITMEMINPPQELAGGISGTACQLTAEKTGLEKIFTRIHQSLTLKSLSQ
jgi:hypothetical protein